MIYVDSNKLYHLRIWKISDFNTNPGRVHIKNKEYPKTSIFWFGRSRLSKDNFNCVINNILPRKHIGTVKNKYNKYNTEYHCLNILVLK